MRGPRGLAALCLALALLAWASPGRCAADAAAPQAGDGRAKLAERWKDVLGGKVPGGPGKGVPKKLEAPEPPEFAEPDPATAEAYRAALREYYTYLRTGLQHRQRVFLWQHYSSIAIFAVVLLLVAAGIYFAAVQFHVGLRQARGEAPAATEFEAGSAGIKVSSPVLGVIILVISLAFFYLYLAFVYPISEIF